MKDIYFKPKSIAEAKAALLLGKEAGYGRNYDAWVYNDQFEDALNGMHFEKAGYTCHGNIPKDKDLIRDLGTLVEALSKPVKESKHIITIIASSDSIGGAKEDLKCIANPDGSVKVGCKLITKEAVEKFISEYTKYHKES